MFLPHPRVKVSIAGSLRDREVACSASDRQGSNFESCVWRTVSSQSSHHPQEVLLSQFSLYVHKGGLKPDSFHFYVLTILCHHLLCHHLLICPHHYMASPFYVITFCDEHHCDQPCLQQSQELFAVTLSQELFCTSHSYPKIYACPPNQSINQSISLAYMCTKVA